MISIFTPGIRMEPGPLNRLPLCVSKNRSAAFRSPTTICSPPIPKRCRLPKNMDGTDGPRVQFTYDFCEKLAAVTPAKIVYQDERLTTVSAEKMLISADVSRAKRKTVIDKVAASIILQNYLDKKI